MTKANHSQRAHALLSASGADRWVNCTPSARLEEHMPNKSSVFAEEGTLAHELCEAMLRQDLTGATTREFCKIWKGVQVKCKEKDWDADSMCGHAHTYSDYVIQILNEAKLTDECAQLIIEERVDLSYWISEGFGTCDAIVIGNGTMHVIDFKYGQGVKVSPENNSQLKMYALGAAEANSLVYSFDNVELHIVQPRLGHIESWKLSAEDLRAWGELTVKPKARDAYEGKGKCNAGEWCKFCKVKPTCRAAKEAAFALIKEDFDDPKQLSDEEVADVLTKIDQAKDYLNSVAEYALAEAVAGRKKWNGFKVVEGKSNRKWKDEKEVISNLALNYARDKFINEKLKGIGDIEKLVGKKEFQSLLGDLVIKPQGKPTLAPTSDKRAEWEQVNINDFND